MYKNWSEITDIRTYNIKFHVFVYPYFAEKKLFPNVDFYSGIVLKAIGIPTNMFTCIFALSRTVGWISHWHEMMSDPKQKIGRPRQLYTGHNQRKYTPIK